MNMSKAFISYTTSGLENPLLFFLSTVLIVYYFRVQNKDSCFDYNEAETMGDVIDIIMNLPYKNLYYYPVIDNFSKDDTEKIIRSKAENNPRIKLIYYKEYLFSIFKYIDFQLNY